MDTILISVDSGYYLTEFHQSISKKDSIGGLNGMEWASLQARASVSFII